MARGGRRPGAGRKPKAQVFKDEPPVKAAERKLRDRLPELVDKLLSLVLTDSPDPKLLVYAIDRVLGKPTQPVDLEVRRLADRLAEQTGADPEFLIRRAQQLAAEQQVKASGS